MSGSRVKLTRTVIENMGPGDVLWDREVSGFGVRRRTRTTSFFVIYRSRVTSQQRRLTLGRHGRLTVEEARREAKVVLGDVERLRDPQADRMRRRAVPTVADVANQFLNEHVAPKLKPRTAAEYRRLLDKRILPTFGRQRIDAISEKVVGRWHVSLGKTPREANHAAAVLSSLMSFAEARGERPRNSNPVQGLRRYREAAHERYLTPAEFGRLGAALDDAEAAGRISLFAIAAIRLLVLTGARREEVRTLKWISVNLERRLLFLPDSKTGRKTILLNDLAVNLLAALPLTEENAFVFCGAKRGEPIKDMIGPWHAIRSVAGLDNVRLHDLRHSFASMAATNGVPLALLGRLIGHRSIRTTERYAHLLPGPLTDANDGIGVDLARALKPGKSVSLPDKGAMKDGKLTAVRGESASARAHPDTRIRQGE
ncbi:MAG: tyrosine-type recombinase/integrase [Hyphomicrobiaceae bacterium]|nr:tyrosine-type recombinase/integrase [Hyphomicrobiaceae bacterium]